MSSKWTLSYTFTRKTFIFAHSLLHCTSLTEIVKTAPATCRRHSTWLPTRTSGLPASLQTWTLWPETHGSKVQTCYFRRSCRSYSSWLQKGHQQSLSLFLSSLSFVYLFCILTQQTLWIIGPLSCCLNSFTFQLILI